MVGDERFNEAIRRFDRENGEDPRKVDYDSVPIGRELAFSRRVFDMVRELESDPAEELLLAARAHTLRRWDIPRDSYPKTTIGYHEWRDATARYHAEVAERILRDVGYDEKTIERVRDLIVRKLFPNDADARALEDADCIVFIQTKLADYLDEWDERKTINILRRSLAKMTPEGRAKAMSISLGARERGLLLQATAELRRS